MTDVAAPGVNILSTSLNSGAISDPSGYISISGLLWQLLMLLAWLD